MIAGHLVGGNDQEGDAKIKFTPTNKILLHQKSTLKKRNEDEDWVFTSSGESRGTNDHQVSAQGNPKA